MRRKTLRNNGSADKDINVRKYHSLLKGLANSQQSDKIRKISKTANWDHMLQRDRNREGMGTLHEHFHLAIIEYSKMIEHLETFKAKSSRSHADEVVKSVRQIQKHFGRGRDYMVNYYLDRYSMNIDRQHSLSPSIKTIHMDRMFRLEGLNKKISKVSGDVSFSERINREIVKVEHVFAKFYAMVKHMNIPDINIFKQ